ncbi:MAG TPA: type VI secretion system baseplate subunit TssK [Gemmatimonadales bacterium]
MHLSKVVWSEGMYLAQHHFQAQSRYFEDSLQFVLGSLSYKAYGVAGCELDPEALLNGTVLLGHARGVFPDGLAFHMPVSDPPPPPRQIGDAFSPTQESHLLLLTIPAYRRGAANCGPSAEGGFRYVAQTAEMHDDVTGSDTKPVPIGRKNFRLRLDYEAQANEVALPIARIRRDGAGHFVYDSEYVPPCLQIGGSTRLLSLLNRIIEILDAKSAAVAAESSASRKVLREYASREVANFWLLHAVRSSVAPLRHLLQMRTAHPEELYTELSRLAGALCTFAIDSHPRSLPAYDHERLGECFGEIDRHIRSHLEVIIPTNCITLPLRRVTDFLYVGVVIDQRCFGQSQWILGARSEGDRGELISKVPKLVKICSSRHVERLFKEARPGLSIQHLPNPPSAVSPRIGAEYFTVGRSGSTEAQVCWTQIAKSGEVGIYVPGALAGAELELLVVLEG